MALVSCEASKAVRASLCFYPVTRVSWSGRGLPANRLAASSKEKDRILQNYNVVYVGPRISLEHPPNLSISLGGGRETNQDSLSNGE